MQTRSMARKAKKSSNRYLVAPPRTPVSRASIQVANELSLLGLPSEIKCFLELLLVSREIYREAQEVFWLTTSFSFYSHNQLAEFLDKRKKVFSRRPHRYPTQLIRQMRLDISSAYLDDRYGDSVSVLRCLWSVARWTSPTLKLVFHYEKLQTHVAGRRVYYDIDPDEIVASLAELLTRLRAYQAEVKAAALDLRVSKKLRPLKARYHTSSCRALTGYSEERAVPESESSTGCLVPSCLYCLSSLLSFLVFFLLFPVTS